MIEIGPNLKELIMHISGGIGVLIFFYIWLR